MVKITLKANRFNKSKFNETVDTNFNQLLDTTPPSYFDLNLATQEDFFWLYDKFFYTISKTDDGTSKYQSHEYLASSSLAEIREKYPEYSEINSEVQALLDEIADIREENLQLEKESVNLETAIEVNPPSPPNLLGVIGQNVGTSAIDNSTTQG